MSRSAFLYHTQPRHFNLCHFLASSSNLRINYNIMISGCILGTLSGVLLNPVCEKDQTLPNGSGDRVRGEWDNRVRVGGNVRWRWHNRVLQITSFYTISHSRYTVMVLSSRIFQKPTCKKNNVFLYVLQEYNMERTIIPQFYNTWQSLRPTHNEKRSYLCAALQLN